MQLYFFVLVNFVPRTRDKKMAEFPTNERPGSNIAVVSDGKMLLTMFTKSSGEDTST